MRLFHSDTNFSGDGFRGYLRDHVGWVCAATFLIFLLLFLLLFLFISREMMFAVIAVTTAVAFLSALTGRLFSLETRQAGGDFTEVASLPNTVVMLREDGCRTVFLFANYGENETTVHSSFMLPGPLAEKDLSSSHTLPQFLRHVGRDPPRLAHKGVAQAVASEPGPLDRDKRFRS